MAQTPSLLLPLVPQMFVMACLLLLFALLSAPLVAAQQDHSSCMTRVPDLYQVDCPPYANGSSTGACVEPRLLCDGNKDCPGGTDESYSFCSSFNCSSIPVAGSLDQPYTKCPPYANGSSTGICIYGSLLCDGNKDCPGGTDESYSFCSSFDCSTRGQANCPPYANGSSTATCTDPRNLCNGNKDCPGGTDESYSFCSSFDCSTLDSTLEKCPPYANGRSSGVCTDSRNLCNGIKDCPGGTDELHSFCSSFDCSTIGLQSCPPYANGSSTDTCLSGSLCDGNIDCPGGTDETVSLCSSFDCSINNQVKCPPYANGSSTNTCTFLSNFCNGNVDCPGGTDESYSFCSSFNCSIIPGDDQSTSFYSNCPPYANGSSTGACTGPQTLCDKNVDCPGGTDESYSFCSSFNCSINGLANCPPYANGSSTATCFAPWLACDGNKDCPGGTDESYSFCSSFNCSINGKANCPAYANGSSTAACTDPQNLCNGIKDCPGGTDESYSFCSSFNCSTTGTLANCPPYANGSSTGFCTDEAFFCDGNKDCPGGTDEVPSFCATFDCSSIGRLRCAKNETLCTKGQYCDGINDCAVGANNVSPDEDPAFCKSFHCPDGQLKCKDGVQCLPILQFCDGSIDCKDGSDEDAGFCLTFNNGGTAPGPAPAIAWPTIYYPLPPRPPSPALGPKPPPTMGRHKRRRGKWLGLHKKRRHHKKSGY